MKKYLKLTYQRTKVRNQKRKINLSDERRLTFKGWLWLALKYLLVIIVCIFILYPIFYLLSSAFNGSLSKLSLRTQESFAFSFKHFQYLSETKYWTWMFNSIIIGSICMFLVLILTGFLAYAMSRYKFRGKKSSLVFIILIQLVPNLLAIMIFYILSDIFSDNLNLPRMIVLILLYTGGGVIGNTYVLKSYMDSISKELDDSAKIQGLTNWNIFLKIISPLAKPMLTIIAFWAFMAPFGDFILSALILVDQNNWTLPLGLESFVASNDVQEINYPAFAAGSILVAAPIIILFLSIQKNIAKGLSLGAIKG